MTTKGIIKSIDFNSNTCEVRMPLFENANDGEEIISKATISTQPGAYNGYKEGDVVILAFEEERLNLPVVLGKLYLGATKENDEGRGTVNCSSLTVADKASLPISTSLTFDAEEKNTVGVDKDYSCYKSIADIIDALQTQEKTTVGIIDDGTNIGARLTQLESDSVTHEAMINANAKEITNRVTKTQDSLTTGFGWSLQSDNWKLTATEGTKSIDILTANNEGLKLKGSIDIEGFAKEFRVYYAKNSSPSEAPAKDEFGPTYPTWEQGKYIWQRQDTKTAFDTFDPWSLGTPVCLTGAKGEKGEPGSGATVRRLNVPVAIHTGVKQTKNIVITAYKTVGEENEQEDAAAILYVNGKKREKDTGTVAQWTITAADCQTKYPTVDITLTAKHPNTEAGHESEEVLYATEIIEYSPGTPILTLSRDSGQLKTGSSDTVTSSGTVYIGEDIISLLSDAFTWTWKVGTTDKEKTGPTIAVTNSTEYFADNADTNTFKLTATYNEKTYSKVLTVSRVKDGTKGEPGDPGTNGDSVHNVVHYKANNNSKYWPDYNPLDPTDYSKCSEWPTEVIEPTNDAQYVWESIETITVERPLSGEPVITRQCSKPIVSKNLEDMISILTADGIDLISKTPNPESITGYTYRLQADSLKGAVSDTVTVAGWELNHNKLTSGNTTGTVTLQSNGDSSNYAAANYISVTDGQWLDTGYKCTSPVMTIELQIEASPQDAEYNIIGNVTNKGIAGNLYGFTFGNFAKKFFLCTANGDQEENCYTNEYARAKYTVKVELKSTGKKYITINGTTFEENYTKDISASNETIKLFNRGDGLYSAIAGTKLYYCRIYERGKLVRNYIPAYKHGEFGLQELVTGTFTTSKTEVPFDGAMTEDFMYTYVYNGIRYSRLEYLQSDGTNYIDTALLADDTTEIAIDFQTLTETSTFGGNDAMFNYTSSATYKNGYLYYSGTGPYGAAQAESATRQFIEIKHKQLYRDHTSVAELPTGTFRDTQNLLLFARRNDSGQIDDAGTTRLYSCKIWQNTVLKYSFVPVKNQSNGKLGLLDLVTGEFFVSPNGNKFTGKDLIPTTGETFTRGDDTYRVLKYISNEVIGGYIDTGWYPNYSTGFTISIQYTPTDVTISEDTIDRRCCLLSNYTNTSSEALKKCLSLEVQNNGSRFYMFDADISTITEVNTDGVNTTRIVYKNGYWSHRLNNNEQNGTLTSYETGQSTTTCRFFVDQLGRFDVFTVPLRFYSCTITENENRVHNYIPVVKNNTIFGVYDTITDTFISSGSSTSFEGLGYPYEFNAIYLGSEEETVAPFRVTNTGKLFAEEATISGHISAQSGELGGFTVAENALYNTAIPEKSSDPSKANSYRYLYLSGSDYGTSGVVNNRWLTDETHYWRPNTIEWSDAEAPKISCKTSAAGYGSVAPDASGSVTLLEVEKNAFIDINDVLLPTKLTVKIGIALTGIKADKTVYLKNFKITATASTSGLFADIRPSCDGWYEAGSTTVSKDFKFTTVSITYNGVKHIDSEGTENWISDLNLMALYTSPDGELDSWDQKFGLSSPIYISATTEKYLRLETNFSTVETGPWLFAAKDKFGITNEGRVYCDALLANNLVGSGSINVTDGGTIGSLDVTRTGITTNYIDIADDKMALKRTGNKSGLFTLGNGLKMQIDSTSTASLIGGNSGGFTFTAGGGEKSYILKLYHTKTEAYFLRKKWTFKYVLCDASGTALTSALTLNKTLTINLAIHTKGQSCYESVTWTSGSSQSPTGEFATIYSWPRGFWWWNNDNLELTSWYIEGGSGHSIKFYNENGHEAPVYALGSIVPDTSNKNTKNLGRADSPWAEVFSKKSTTITTQQSGSDRRLKMDINNLSATYDTFFDNLRPVTYRFNIENTDTKLHTGFIAQEVEQAAIKAGIDESDLGMIDIIGKLDTYVLNYNDIIAMNTDQIQKLKKRITELEEKLSALEKE